MASPGMPGLKFIWVAYGGAVVAHASAFNAGEGELASAARDFQSKTTGHGKYRVVLGSSVNGSIVRQGNVSVGAFAERVAPAVRAHLVLASHMLRRRSRIPRASRSCGTSSPRISPSGAR